MVTCEPLQLGSEVLVKYKSCKQELNFDKDSDEMFLDFLLDTSVKVIDISKLLSFISIFQSSILPAINLHNYLITKILIS